MLLLIVPILELKNRWLQMENLLGLTSESTCFRVDDLLMVRMVPVLLAVFCNLSVPCAMSLTNCDSFHYYVNLKFSYKFTCNIFFTASFSEQLRPILYTYRFETRANCAFPIQQLNP